MGDNMRLRNKKTGEVIDLDIANIKAQYGGISVIPEPVKLGGVEYVYYSLDGLVHEWEDYDPKEPLIDDEDARDAVYSWASKLQIHQVKCKIGMRGLGVVVTTFQACSLNSAPIIEFTSLYANVVHGGTYTIAELCGEEEE